MNEKKLEFYYGAASGSSRKALRKMEEPNVMINYATQNNKPWEGIENLFVDSGGYSFILGKGEYTTTNKEYLEYVEKHQPELFALRDYPCEPDVLEEHDRTVEEHQEMTIEKHKELRELMKEFDIKSKPLSVIQGWEIEDYLDHIERMKEEDLITEHIGIGSICRRGQDEEIRRIILEVNKALPDYCKIHAFGVKSNILRFAEVCEVLHSADSMAYEYSEQYGQRISGTKTKSFRDSTMAYLKFKKEINRMIKTQQSQRSLQEVC